MTEYKKEAPKDFVTSKVDRNLEQYLAGIIKEATYFTMLNDDIYHENSLERIIYFAKKAWDLVLDEPTLQKEEIDDNPQCRHCGTRQK